MTTAIVTGLLIGTFTNFLVFLSTSLSDWFESLYNQIYFNAMCVEINFTDINLNITGIYRTIYTFAIALLMMFFIKKMIETYMAWSNGDPETSPMSVLVGFIKALIIMISFGFIYETFVTIFYNLFESLSNTAFPGDTAKFIGLDENSLYATSFIGNAIYFIIMVLFILIYFQNIGRGIEMFILRLGLPFACIGLLNADGGAFKGYSQKMIKVAFTVIVQLLLIKLAIALLKPPGFHLAMSLATSIMAYKTPGLLNEFMATAGSGYYGAREMGSMATRFSVITRGMKKGIK